MGSFWNDAGLEPKRSFRFLLSIMGAGTKLDNFLIKKEEEKIKFLTINSRFNIK